MQPDKRRIISILFFLLVWIISFPSGSALAAETDETLYRIKSNGLYGFIDKQGTIVISPRYTGVRQLNDGLIAVQTGTANKWGYIDRSGKFVIWPRFRQAYDFSEGLAAVSVEPNGNVGYIDKSGKLVIPSVFQSGDPFHNGKARVQTTTTLFIDTTGAIILETPYPDAWELSNGYIAFFDGSKLGFLDKQGKVVIAPTFHRVTYGRQDLFNEKITPVSNGPKNQNSWGFIDTTGKTVVKFEYDWAEQFQEGMAIVCKNKLYGFVDTTGVQIIPLRFEEAWKFREGLAAVKTGGLWGFIDKKGGWVIPPQYQSLIFGAPIEFHYGLAVVRTANGTGVINRAGEMVVAPIYRMISDFDSNGIAEVMLPYSERGYIDRTGRYIWTPSW